MGRGYVYKCPKCGLEQTIYKGRGFMTLTEVEQAKENILSGFYGPKAQATLVAHPEAIVGVERAVYQCRDCGKLESLLTVKVTAPDRVPIHHRCDCGKIMHRIRSGGEMFCPACREPLKNTDILVGIKWD